MVSTHRLSSPAITADEIDDLIYSSRTGDLEQLKQELNDLSTRYDTLVSQIITFAIDTDSGSNNSLLHYPSANSNLEILNYLLSELINQPTADSTHSQANSLVNHQNSSGNTALHWAAVNGNLEIVQALVKAGADPTIVNSSGRDAVVEAEYSAKEGAEKCADFLLKECAVLEQGSGGPVMEGDVRDEMTDVSGQDAADAGESHTNGVAEHGT